MKYFPLIFLLTTSSLFGQGVIRGTRLDLGSNPADAGAIRLVNAALIGWEADPAGTDVTFGVTAAERFAASAGMDVTGTVSSTGLLLSSGSVINFDGGDVTLTHSANTLTVAGGNLVATGTLASGNAVLTAIETETLNILDAVNQDAALQIIAGSDLSVARTLTLLTGDASRQITLSGNPTLGDWFDQSVKTGASPTFVTVNATTLAGAGGGITYDATGNDGNLTVDDNTLQEVAQALDDLVSAGSVATDTIFDAAGDLVQGTGANTSARLAIGTANQLLQVNAGATAAEWTSDIEVGTITAGATTVTGLEPLTDDTVAIGNATTKRWADLFLAEGGVINWDNGDATITQTGDDISVGGISTLTSAGTIVTTVGFDVVGAADIDYGSADVTDHTFITDGTGTAEIVLPAGSIDGTEILNDTVDSDDYAAGSIDNEHLSSNARTGVQTLAEGESIALDPAGSADGAFSGTTVTGTAGADLAFGDLIYLDPTDSRWELADANSAAAADGDARGMLGICVNDPSADGQPVVVLLQGIVRADAAFPALTVNATLFVSETAGDITHTAPTTEDNVVRHLGAAMTGDQIYFNPSYSWITYDVP